MELYPAFEDTLLGARADLAAGRRTCEDLLDDCLQIIDERESSVQAWVLIDRDGARRTAWERDAELKSGASRGPLHGIPVGIKDIIDIEGWPTAAGSKLKADDLADADAPLVRRLKTAGAVLLGKTVTTQFASFDPSITRNPWNLDRTPGGSSSGSAAAVAAGMCLGAVGTQTGGSIIRPASFCGVAGLKPTYGSISLEGIVPLSVPMDHPGPLARTVRDTAAIFAAMADFAEESPGFPDDWSTLIEEPEFPAPKLAELAGVFQEEADADMLHGLMNAMEKWIRGGAFVESITLPDEFEQVRPAHRILMARGAANFHKERFARHPDDYQPAIKSLIEEGLQISESDWNEALLFQKSCRDMMLSMFAEVDVLITPASVGAAPDLATTGNPVMNSPWSFCGFPTITFPLGLSEDGLPLGVQLIGKPGAELPMYRAAIWCETVLRESQS